MDKSAHFSYIARSGTAGLYGNCTFNTSGNCQTSKWLNHFTFPAAAYDSFYRSTSLPMLSGTPLQYSCLENPMDGGAWWAAVHGVARSRTRLSDFIFTFHFHALEKEMATHPSVLAWRTPGTGGPGGLLSMGSHGVGHD